MPVHLYGQMCEMDPLVALARKHNLVIIEDAAQAIAATDQGRPAGSFGTGCFSLYATKNVMSAEGGMITTNEGSIASQARLLRNHGQQATYLYDQLGYNLRMTDLHAAIGFVQLGRVEAFTVKREANAKYLTGKITSVLTPLTRSGVRHVWHQYTVRVVDGMSRDAACRQLGAAGIGTGVYYPIPVHRFPFVQAVAGKPELPVTDLVAQEVFSIPVHPLLTESDLTTIVAEVNRL